tara:strand:- start:5082 stop:7199 length:2118 start_codon:yes stop_codon:yes gene_type:complete
MALQQFTNLNFEDIKTSIKNYIKQNSNFSDMDFEGSNLSTLINILAYNSYSTAYNTNMAINETFIDSATLRENVVSLARNIGYVPRSRRAARATINLSFVGLTSTTEQVTIQPGIVCNGAISNVNYIFSIPESITMLAEEGTASGSIEIFQGQYLTSRFVVNNNNPSERYVIPNNGVDTSTINIKVKNSLSDNTSVDYKLVDNIIGVTSTSNIFLLQETTDEKYEVLFGDNIFGKKLESGNVVDISYIKTNGKEGNGASKFNFVGNVINENNATETDFIVSISAQNKAENGDDIEPVESVKYYAPRLYAAQHRAVTANDYEALLPSIYPNIESVSSYGGEELNPPQFGRVFIAAKPKNGSFLSELTKKNLLNSLKNYSIAGIVPSFVDLKFLYVEIDSYIYYNSNFVGDVDNLKSNVIKSLTTFATGTELNKFGGRFKYSKILSLIDGVDASVTSNITLVRMRRNINAKLNQFAQYEVCYLNQIYAANSQYNIHSTGFTVSNVVGTCYISDIKIDDDSGSIFLFQILNDDSVKVITNNFGRIDYKKGEIVLDAVNITGTLEPDGIIEVEVIPQSNDVLAKNELYLQFEVNKSTFFMREDSISTGADTSGSRYLPQSSYFGAKKVRGAVVTSTTTETTLVGYVNGQPYYGEFHTMIGGNKMTGATHSVNSKQITDTPEGNVSVSAQTTTTSTTSSTSSSSSSSSGY